MNFEIELCPNFYDIISYEDLNYFLDYKEIDVNQKKFEVINFYCKNETKLFTAKRESPPKLSKNEYDYNDVNLLSLMLVQDPKRSKNIFEILLLYEAKKRGYFPKPQDQDEEFYNLERKAPF